MNSHLWLNTLSTGAVVAGLQKISSSRWYEVFGNRLPAGLPPTNPHSQLLKANVKDNFQGQGLIVWGQDQGLGTKGQGQRHIKLASRMIQAKAMSWRTPSLTTMLNTSMVKISFFCETCITWIHIFTFILDVLMCRRVWGVLQPVDCCSDVSTWCRCQARCCSTLVHVLSRPAVWSAGASTESWCSLYTGHSGWCSLESKNSVPSRRCNEIVASTSSSANAKRMCNSVGHFEPWF